MSTAGGHRKKNYRPQTEKWVGGLRVFLHKKSFCINFSHYNSVHFRVFLQVLDTRGGLYHADIKLAFAIIYSVNYICTVKRRYYAEKGVDWRRGQHNAAGHEPGSYSILTSFCSIDSAALSS